VRVPRYKRPANLFEVVDHDCSEDIPLDTQVDLRWAPDAAPRTPPP